jgi:glutaredoxin-related protein
MFVQKQHSIIIITDTDTNDAWERTHQVKCILSNLKFNFTILDVGDPDDEEKINMFDFSSIPKSTRYPYVYVANEYLGDLPIIMKMNDDNLLHSKCRYMVNDNY